MSVTATTLVTLVCMLGTAYALFFLHGTSQVIALATSTAIGALEFEVALPAQFGIHWVSVVYGLITTASDSAHRLAQWVLAVNPANLWFPLDMSSSWIFTQLRGLVGLPLVLGRCSLRLDVHSRVSFIIKRVCAYSITRVEALVIILVECQGDMMIVGLIAVMLSVDLAPKGVPATERWTPGCDTTRLEDSPCLSSSSELGTGRGLEIQLGIPESHGDQGSRRNR
ncbi:hypothetical protein RhiJN_01716 [Ceratobasidium sp. AG-Ba]|nr:hypothetical protein RhiJN_01716 [Ceratobasidium sp. AG-Ba]QRW02643.1 hypothetical protein RhiLY_01642 [Ceratobasidium sp. AG-Ba]